MQFDFRFLKQVNLFIFKFSLLSNNFNKENTLINISAKLCNSFFKIIFGIILLSTYSEDALAITKYNANGSPLMFLQSRKSVKTSTDANLNSITLYTNVITISGQAIDCVVKITSKSSSAQFTLPASPTGGTRPYTPFDVSATSGTSYSSNKDSFFHQHLILRGLSVVLLSSNLF